MKAKGKITRSQYEAMSHSQKLNYQKLRLKRKKRRRDRLIFSLVLLFVCGLGIALSFTVFFKIEAIEVEGNKKYVTSKIIEESEISLNENMFMLNTKKVGKRLEKSLPYIGKAEVKRVLPDKILINISETKPMFAVKEKNTYSLLDENSKLLEKGLKKPPKNIIELVGIDIKDAEPGLMLKDLKPHIKANKKDKPQEEKDKKGEKDDPTGQTTEKADQEIGELIDVLTGLAKALKEAEIEDINLFDLSDINNIKLVYQGRLSLLLGRPDNLECKLRLGKKVIEEENEKRPFREGIIDLTIDNKASVRGEEYTTRPQLTEESTEEETSSPDQA